MSSWRSLLCRRVSQARNSSALRALPRESIGSRWRTGSNVSTGSPPTRWVGESGLRSSGCSASSALQLVEQRVVGVVADLGIVEDVVAMVVAGDLAAELLRPLGRILGAHPAPVIAASSIPSRSQSRSRPRPSRSVRSKCTGVIAIRPRATAARSVPGSSSKEGSKP